MKIWLRKLVAEVGLAEYLVPAFKFQCDFCGANICAPVPEPGTWIDLPCGSCKEKHHLYWTGEFWKYESSKPAGEFVSPSFAVWNDRKIAEDGVRLIQDRQERQKPQT